MVGSDSDTSCVESMLLVVPARDEASEPVICADVNEFSGERDAGVYEGVDWHDRVPGAELTL